MLLFEVGRYLVFFHQLIQISASNRLFEIRVEYPAHNVIAFAQGVAQGRCQLLRQLEQAERATQGLLHQDIFQRVDVAGIYQALGRQTKGQRHDHVDGHREHALAGVNARVIVAQSASPVGNQAIHTKLQYRFMAMTLDTV